MSTLAKSIQAGITYPSCTFCGGTLVNGSSKNSPKRKSALCQLSLYTNSSESFIVWYKKQDEPKGILWMRSCCIRKGSDENAVELISRGCRGRCSYTLKFSSSRASEEWYRLLKQESRKIPSLGDELPFSVDEGYLASLDSMLTDISPLNVLNEVLHNSDDDTENNSSLEESKESKDHIAPLQQHQRHHSPTTSPKSNKKSVKSKLINPLQGLTKNKKTSVSTISSSLSSSTVGSVNPLESIENNTPSDDYLSRWSWPMKV